MSRPIRVERIIDQNYKLPKDISNRLDYVYLILMICRLLVNEDKQYIPNPKEKEKVSTPFLRVVEENLRNRAYVFLARDKFFSIFFPFRIYSDKVSGKVSIYYEASNILDDVTLSECISFKEDMTDKENGPVAEKGKSYNEVVLDDTYSDKTYKVMNMLMLAEPCYVRYDHDLKSKNQRIHPIDHMDVNFNKLSTFKLGLRGRVNPDGFESYLSPDTDVLFCNVGSPKYYNKQKTLRDIRQKSKAKYRFLHKKKRK